MVKNRHPTIFSNWGTIQLIFVMKARGNCHFRFHCVLHKLKDKKIDAIWQPYWIYEEWSYMIDIHLIVFLDNQNLGVDTKIGFLSGTVSKLLNI